MPQKDKGFRQWTRKSIIYLVDTVPVEKYFYAFIAVVIVCGILYSWLDRFGHGAVFDGKSPISLWEGIYFSVVTVSTLGYGDIHPLGVSRFLACAEVLFGLAFIGIVLARMTSRRISHHVVRLYSADAQRRVDQFYGRFADLQKDLALLRAAVARSYQNTPGSVPGGDKADAKSKFFALFELLRLHSSDLAEYLSYETDQTGDFFSIIPTDSIRRIGGRIDSVFFEIGQLVMSLSPDSKIDLLDGTTRQHITDTISSQKRTGALVLEYSNDDKTKESFSRVVDSCERVLQAYFITPASAASQPDQVLPEHDSPQEPV